MTRFINRITSSLAGKLLLTIGLLMMLSVGMLWYTLITSGENNLTKNAVRHAASYSDLIKRSVHYDMLTFHRDHIQHRIESIGLNEDIKKITIFDSTGRIFYSSDHREIGLFVERSSVACLGCHTDPMKPSETLKAGRQWTTYEGKEGYRVLTYVEPIYNERSCYTASCHVHSENQRVLGVLQTDSSLLSVDSDIRKQTLNTTLYALVFTGMTSVILFLFLRKFVHKPVSVLSKGVQKVAQGDFTQRVEITSRDEIGLLAGTFNMMAEDLQRTTVSRDLLTEEVNERKQVEDELRQSEEKYKNLFEATMDGVYQVDADGIFTMMNPAGARIFGYEHPAEIIGTNALQFWRDPGDRDVYRGELNMKKSVSAYPIGARKRDGEPIELESSSMILEDAQGNFLGIKGILRDVTERKRAEEELHYLSVIDELTGLNNRRGFLILATQQIKIAERLKQGAVLVYADMDKMKWVNDTFGHKEGDRALIDIANVLKNALRASDIIARWGGDEFVVLALESGEAAREMILARLLENLNAHNSQGNRPYKLSISFGLTQYDPENPCALEEMLERGDKLMYEEKQKRKMHRTERSGQ